MRRRTCGRLLSTLLLLFSAFGCGSKVDYPVAPVSGHVLLDKRPLANARVHFRPITPQGAPDSYGETDENGHYTLEVVTSKGNEKGAVVGEHQVYISLPGYAVENTKSYRTKPRTLARSVSEEGCKLFPRLRFGLVGRRSDGVLSGSSKNLKRAPAEILPPRYSGSESKLRFTVPPEGTDKADFLDLTSK